MNQLQERKRSMYYVVEEFLATVPAATMASMPQFEVVLTDFTNKVMEIKQQSELQTQKRVGERMLKEDYRLSMSTQAISVSSKIKGYAINTNKVVLREEMSQRLSYLLRLADTVTADVCQFIHEKGTALLGDLANYGVTQDMLDNLQKRIDDFRDSIPKPRMGIVERKKATDEMKVLFAACDAYLKTMGNLVDMLQYSDKEFYDTFYSSRRIIKPAYRTLSITGTITDENGQPLPKVIINLKETLIERKTSDKGGFEIKGLESKMYTMDIQKPGYESVSVLVAVTATQRTEVVVAMKPSSDSVMKVA